MDTPKQELRQVAAEAGRKRYLGSACRKCGQIERYTTNGACIACSVARERSRRVAIRAMLQEARRG